MPRVPADGGAEEQCLAIFDMLQPGTKFVPSRMPEFIWQKLNGILKKDELLHFLIKHPTRFHVLSQADGSWAFKTGNFLAPADGGAPAEAAPTAIWTMGAAPTAEPAAAKAFPAPPPMPSRRVPIPPGLGPANGGVASWTVGDVISYLDRLELSHVTHVVQDSGIDGRMLLELVDNYDLVDVGFTKLQAHKISHNLPRP